MVEDGVRLRGVPGILFVSGKPRTCNFKSEKSEVRVKDEY
jgi:hypothetical protein